MTVHDSPEIAGNDESRIAHLRGHGAVLVGKRLIRKHPDSAAGYELAARGYEDLGRPKSAVRILEKGVARRPQWRLLESLAIRYSDSARYEEALEALDEALAQSPREPLLHYNLALVLERVDRDHEALDAALRALDLDPALSRAALLAAALECKLHRLEDAARRLEATIEALLEAEPSRREEAVLSDAYLAQAEIELAFRRRERAVELFWRAIAHEKHNAAARYWIRELTGERNPDACYWRVVVRGRWPAELPLPREDVGGSPFRSRIEGRAASGVDRLFKTLYDVVAQSPDEALELIRAFEPPEVRPLLGVDSAKVMKRSVSDPKGVYRTSPYRWYEIRFP